MNFDGNANAQNLIDTFRKRLCYEASKETRELAEDFKIELHKSEPELANVLVPNCIYRHGCPEFESCGYIDQFIREHYNLISSDIRMRYNLYNNDFYKRHGENNE